MENQSQPTPLELKINLLKSLREGNLDISEHLLSKLQTITKTHPQLYRKFHQFVHEHKLEIKEMDRQDKEKEEQNFEIVDTQSEGSSWVTDDSVSLSSEEEQQEKKDTKVKSRLLKNVANCKSAVLLKPIKQVKKPFYVQTKPKDIVSSTLNIRQSSPSSKILAENKSHIGLITTKSFAKISSKKILKPYFPPINAAKMTLKL